MKPEKRLHPSPFSKNFPRQTPQKCLHLTTDWPKGDEGVSQIERWIAGAHNPRMIVIDTLAKWRPQTKAGRSIYEQDYEALAPLQKMAGTHALSIVVVHHLRKAADADVFAELSGSHGLMGCANTTFILKRSRGHAAGSFHITGRDIDEKELGIEFRDCQWRVLGDAEKVRQSENWKAVLALCTRDGEITIASVSTALDTNRDAAKKILHRMQDAGHLRAVAGGRGKYVASVPSVPTVPGAWEDGDADEMT